MEMNAIIALCRKRNATIDGMMAREELTLDSWIEEERAKLDHNMSIPVIEKRDDLIALCGAYIEKYVSKEAAQNVTDVMEYGILYTANHLGGLYSAQSFQGDLCYTHLLKKLDPDVPCVPMVSFGLVPLNSSTFARGLIAYGKTSEAEHFPIFPKAPTNAAASLTESYTADMVRRTRDKAINEAASFLVRKQLRGLMNDLYLRKDILAKKRFAEQVLLLGEGLYERLFSMTLQRGYYHMEAEALFAKLFLIDFGKKDGLLGTILSDPSVRQIFNETTDAEDRAFSGLLFRGCGTDKRCFSLNLDVDGFLRGQDVSGKAVELRADFSTLSDALKQERILPHVYLSWLMSGFLRGFTWYGGVLQSQYLQDWQRRTCEMLTNAGFSDEAKKRQAYDCSGYLSGPVYLLFNTGDGATNAGPLECMVKMPTPERLERCFLQTTLKEAHEMGMFEFYNDLTLPHEKEEGWYGTISAYCKKYYEAHTLQAMQTV